MDTSQDVKLNVMYYYRISETSPEGEPTKIGKKSITSYFPPDATCHEVHRALCVYAKSGVALFADKKCILGGTVEKSLMGKELVVYSQEIGNILIKKFEPQQEVEDITMEDVIALYVDILLYLKTLPPR